MTPLPATREPVWADPVLTQRVLASFGTSGSDRFAEVMRSLVEHLHAFAGDVALTESEWMAAIAFITSVGQISDDRRQEAILLSDVLGLSMLTVAINHPVTEQATESTVFGPFFTTGSPVVAQGGDLSGGAAGQPCYYDGQVSTPDGAPVASALMEVWHADEDGNYDVQYGGLAAPQGRGHLLTDSAGRYRFRSVLPEPYPIPDDGPVGELLRAAGRCPMRPAHVHFMISAPGCATLTTHVFRSGDPHLGSDAVFGEKDSLVAEFVRHEADVPSPDGMLDRAWFSLTYRFVLDRAVEPVRSGPASPVIAP